MTTPDENEMEQAAAEAALMDELQAAEASWHAYQDYVTSLRDDERNIELPY